jgi:hypothetical protein
MITLSPRHFVLPLIALAIISSLPVPAASGRGDETCGPAVHRVNDRALRAEFEAFDHTQSAAAAKICALYRNTR